MNSQSNQQQKGHIFLVGCPRSGTTLLQSLLAAHPDIISFPESHLFRKLRMNYWTRLIGLANLEGREQLKFFLAQIGQEKCFDRLPKNPLFIRQYTSIWVEAMDAAAEEQNKTLWVEKSPEHVGYVYYIEKLVPRSKFIHLVRNGADVVASLYEVSRKYQRRDVWGEPWEIDKCIDHWLTYLQRSQQHLHKPNHKLVRYEQLVANPEQVLMDLCTFMGVAFTPSLLENYGKMAQQVIRQDETWKAGVGQQIQNANATKFYQLFDEEQQRYIMNRLSSINLEVLTV